MTNTNNIEMFINEKGIRRDGIVLFRPEDAILLIDILFEASIPVLGIDGFYITDSTTQSPIEDIFDNSSGVVSLEIKEELKSFVLARKEKGLYFEITY
jgi:hypothetical protein